MPVNFPQINIPAGLQRQVFLDKVLVAFKRRILPLLAFSTRFSNVPLEGNDKMGVPFYPLSTQTTKDFDKTVGYDLTGAATQDVREIIVNRRKYLPLVWTSQDLRRQPYLDPERLAVQVADKLAYDVLQDIFSIITIANFGIAVMTPVSAASFDFEQIMDLKDICDRAYWSEEGRGLVLDSTHANWLNRDERMLLALKYGEAGGVATGERPKAAGFTPYSTPLLPDNGEKLAGFATFPSAVLVGFSPVRPTPEVEKLLTAYELYTDPDTLLTLEYRRGGDPIGDKSFETIECNYGYAKGQEEALKRIERP